MTQKEYLAKTDIRSLEEARSRLKRLKILFISVFVSMIFIRLIANQINENTLELLYLGYIALLIAFVVYCVENIKLTRQVTKANAVWSVIFAPISWIWFYPEITRPFKIIIGEIEPPDKLSNELLSEEAKKAKEVSNNNLRKTIKTIVIVIAIAVGIAVLLVVFNSQPGKYSSSNTTVKSPPQVQKELSYHYVASDPGFEADFPNAPTREENTEHAEDGSGYSYVTYQATKNNFIYYVFYFSFDNTAVDEYGSNYNVKTGLEASLNEYVNGIKDSKLISSDFTTFLGHRAIDYKIDANPKIIEGTIFFNGRHLYMLAIEYPTTANVNTNYIDYKNDFKISEAANVLAPSESKSETTSAGTIGTYNQDKITASVVNILCPSGTDGSGGSGTIVDSSGLILTNNHIIPQDKNGVARVELCLVTLPDSQGKIKEIYFGKPITIPVLSKRYDLAFVKISEAYIDDEGTSYGEYPNKFPSFFENGCENTDPKLGEKIRVFGYPAISGGGYFLTITDGIVSSLPNDGTIVTSAKVDHGSSGGIAVDGQGCIVGVPSMISGDINESLGVIISDSVITEFVTKLQAQL